MEWLDHILIAEEERAGPQWRPLERLLRETEGPARSGLGDRQVTYSGLTSHTSAGSSHHVLKNTARKCVRQSRKYAINWILNSILIFKCCNSFALLCNHHHKHSGLKQHAFISVSVGQAGSSAQPQLER